MADCLHQHRRTIGVFLEVGQATMRKVVSGIMAYAQQHGNWNVCIPESQAGESLDCLLGGRWDGVIAGFDDPHGPELLRMAVPLVGVGSGYGWYRPDADIPYVGTDNAAVARLAADHLREQGFVHFAYCGYHPTPVNRCSRRRAEAFHEAVVRAGNSCAIYDAPNMASDTWATICGDLIEWLSELPRPVGIMACNDSRARQILEACRIANLRVPNDVAIVGVDDEEAICLFTDPTLTSVDQGSHRSGYEAASLLNRWIEGGAVAPGKRTVAPVGIVARGSTSLPAGDDELAAAVQFIRNHAHEAIGLDDVARAAGTNPATLGRRFRSLLGRTVREEIQRARIDHVKQLLVSTDWPLKQVARQSGFCSVQYMTTRIRQATGCTPREYRRRHAVPGVV